MQILTEEPLQGLIMSANTRVIHISLLIAQPCCYYYFGKWACPIAKDSNNFIMMYVHGWCVLASLISKYADHYK